jgi:hypothetical protein
LPQGSEKEKTGKNHFLLTFLPYSSAPPHPSSNDCFINPIIWTFFRDLMKKIIKSFIAFSTWDYLSLSVVFLRTKNNHGV